jgi:membrane-associated protease RseP (regulator of RpoE activity)
MTGPTPAPKTWLNGLLFVLTCLTVCYAGLAWAANFIAAGASPGGGLLLTPEQVSRDPRLFPLSALYAAVLMTILIGHEAGHYLTSRRYGLPATLPYFLPGLPPLGTFGAFIRIRSHMPFRRQVFDVGANGPLVGFALTLPVLAVGLALSRVAPFTPSEGAISFGEPLLFKLLARLFLGPIPGGSDIVLHPIGWAGWVGLLVTGFNLLPLGQFDGGHVAYALLGRRARTLSRGVIIAMAVLGFFFLTWLVLAGVLIFLHRRGRMPFDHPRVFDEQAPLGTKRTVLGALIVLVFALSFIPVPARGFGLLDLLSGRLGLF